MNREKLAEDIKKKYDVNVKFYFNLLPSNNVYIEMNFVYLGILYEDRFMVYEYEIEKKFFGALEKNVVRVLSTTSPNYLRIQKIRSVWNEINV